MDGMIGKKKPNDEEHIDDAMTVHLEDIDQAILDDIVAERDHLRAEQDRILRAAADAQNRLRTARKDVQEAHRQGVTAVARDIIGGLDSFDVALMQDMSTSTVESIIDGVRSIRSELIRVLARHGVGLIEATPGEEMNPERHQAMMEQPTGDFEPGQIVSMVQVGYVLNDRVIRPAKVIVAACPPDADCSDDDNPGTADQIDRVNELDVDSGPFHIEVTDGDESSSDDTNPPMAESEGTPDPDGVYHIEDESGEGLLPPEPPRED